MHSFLTNKGRQNWQKLDVSILEKEHMPGNTASSNKRSMIGRSDFLIFHDHSYKKTFPNVSVLTLSGRDKQHISKMKFPTTQKFS